MIKEEEEEEESCCQPLALVTPNNRKHFPAATVLAEATENLPLPLSPAAGDEATVSTTTPCTVAVGDGGRAAATPPDSTQQPANYHTHLVTSSQATGPDFT